MAEPTLLGMPLELLVYIIATYLSTKDLGALRLTNKYLETALFNSFAKEFFTKKQFMLSTNSLETLIEISKHPTFGKVVQHVIIGLEQFEPSLHEPLFANVTAVQYQTYRNGWSDQMNLMCSGRARILLAEAFRGLPNLKTIGLRDYAANGRMREHSRWRSYGAPTVERESGRNFPKTTSKFASEAFSLVLAALADAEKTVPNIEVILRTLGIGLTDRAFFLPTSCLSIKNVLEGLEQLLLTLDFDHTLPSFTLRDEQDQPAKVPLHLEDFLLHTPSLTHLRLNFPSDRAGTGRKSIDQITALSKLLPRLQRLDLGMLTLGPDILVQFVSQFAHLKHLFLWKVRICGAESFFDPFPAVLRDMSKNNPQLMDMEIGCITLENRHGVCLPIQSTFGPTVAYRGGISTWRTQAGKEMRVQWPRPHEFSDSEDHSDYDMEDDE